MGIEHNAHTGPYSNVILFYTLWFLFCVFRSSVLRSTVQQPLFCILFVFVFSLTYVVVWRLQRYPLCVMSSQKSQSLIRNNEYE